MFRTNSFFILFFFQKPHLAPNPDNSIHSLILEPSVLEAREAVFHKAEARFVQESLVGIAWLAARGVSVPRKVKMRILQKLFMAGCSDRLCEKMREKVGLLQDIFDQSCSHGLRAIEGLHPQEPVFLRLGLKGVDNVRPEKKNH